ncbi:alpha/beta hydrolase [Chelatococcus sambhunathii]|uniref:Alpha/beta hydrolase n=1 Tax=Chelatococcus sambhunathii TaxID=363953 RepID=A0ABU1DFY5_9HYPH|nr:alpha/beta hydrolase [Chelatococcus sambhunathii]MDR4306955.1 alpha/beta hydrolase [Chelatococcus sambhunathii]
MRPFQPVSDPAIRVGGLIESRALSAQARLLRVVMRYAVKTRVHADPDIARIRRSVERLAAIALDQPFGVARRAATVGGRSAEIHTFGREPDRHVLYLHGGAFVCGSPRTHRGIAGRIARGARAEVVVLDYRLAPEHPFPAALEDAEAAYVGLIERGVDPSRLVIAGDSAGGNLAFALLLKLKGQGGPMPAAAVGLSPFVDFTASGESFRLNAALDPLLHVNGLPSVVEAYAPGADHRNPLLSPIFGDLSGLPPTLIQCGSDEILLDDARRLHAGLSAAGVPCDLEIWPQMPHVWQAFAIFLPEGRLALNRINAFLRRIFESRGDESCGAQSAPGAPDRNRPAA